jgi:hypothetical protein
MHFFAIRQRLTVIVPQVLHGDGCWHNIGDFSRSSEMLTLDAEFDSAEEAENAVNAYAAAHFSPLCKRGCVTVQEYNKKVSV